jgi:hypothetical protein
VFPPAVVGLNLCDVLDSSNCIQMLSREVPHVQDTVSKQATVQLLDQHGLFRQPIVMRIGESRAFNHSLAGIQGRAPFLNRSDEIGRSRLLIEYTRPYSFFPESAIHTKKWACEPMFGNVEKIEFGLRTVRLTLNVRKKPCPFFPSSIVPRISRTPPDKSLSD